MSGYKNQYGPRGLQIVGVAFNPMANMYLPDYIKQFTPNFPIGWALRDPVLEYLQHPVFLQLYVPIVVFIDSNFTIQEQHLGDDPYFKNEDANLRASIEKLLKTSPAQKKSTKKK